MLALVVCSTFVWVHIMKTGGTAVETGLRKMLRGRRDIRFDPADYVGWHDSVSERAARDPGFRLLDRTVVAGIRRLPYWLLSRVYYEASRPPYLCATREMLVRGAFHENDGTPNSADAMLERYLDPMPDHWIRQDHLAEDFAAAFHSQIRFSRASTPRALRTAVNATPIPYLTPLSFYFTPAELDTLYGCNPRWAALESRVYGGRVERSADEMTPGPASASRSTLVNVARSPR